MPCSEIEPLLCSEMAKTSLLEDKNKFVQINLSVSKGRYLQSSIDEAKGLKAKPGLRAKLIYCM
jgi:hypothetical protein